MKLRRLLPAVAIAVASLAVLAAASSDRSKTYKVTADTIEGCSCPLFCECYFNKQPANPHMCKFDNVYKFAPGSHYGDVDLSGAKVWLSGDLGGDWGKSAEMPAKWATITFDKASSPAQRDAIGKIVAKVFPVKWQNVQTREDEISWDNQGDHKSAHMKSGKGDIELAMWKGPDSKQPTVLKNVQYWGSKSNEGFVLAKSKHHFDAGDDKYSFEDANGFTVRWTVEGKVD
jgi:uncharacterized protein DUF1326